MRDRRTVAPSLKLRALERSIWLRLKAVIMTFGRLGGQGVARQEDTAFSYIASTCSQYAKGSTT